MTIDIIVPAAGESVKEADVVNWFKESGAFVSVNEPLVALETEKATLELVAEQSGILDIMVPSGVVSVGDVIARIVSSDVSPSPAPTASAPVTQANTPPPASDVPARMGNASPAAQRLMSESGIHLGDGTGKDGRVTKQDVLRALGSDGGQSGVTHPVPAPILLTPESISSPLSSPVTPSHVVSEGSLNGERGERREGMTRLRKTIMARLVASQQTTASLTTFNEVDMSQVMAIRTRYKDGFKDKYQVGLGFMSFFTKAVCHALQEFPILNAYVEGDEIVYHDYCDVGIAVSAPKGLMVPVIRDAHQLSFNEIESRIVEYANKARQNKLTIQEMEGGTFTITNGGVFGSMMSMPIINRPQSAILGMHNIVNRPVAIGQEVVVRPIMYVALTYDHRIIDGSDAVRFLVRVKEQIEDPIRLLVNV